MKTRPVNKPMQEQELRDIHGSKLRNERILGISCKVCLLFVVFILLTEKKLMIMIPLKNCLDPYSNALIIRLFLNLGSESRKGKKYRTYRCF